MDHDSINLFLTLLTFRSFRKKTETYEILESLHQGMYNIFMTFALIKCSIFDNLYNNEF